MSFPARSWGLPALGMLLLLAAAGGYALGGGRRPQVAEVQGLRQQQEAIAAALESLREVLERLERRLDTPELRAPQREPLGEAPEDPELLATLAAIDQRLARLEESPRAPTGSSGRLRIPARGMAPLPAETDGEEAIRGRYLLMTYQEVLDLHGRPSLVSSDKGTIRWSYARPGEPDWSGLVIVFTDGLVTWAGY